MSTSTENPNQNLRQLGPLRWGIVGCGTIAGDMVNAISLLPSSLHRIIAVAASSPDRAENFVLEKKLGDDVVAYGNYQALFNDPNIGQSLHENRKSSDIVYIALLNSLHKENVIGALNAGKAVLCEKPLGLNVKEVKQMIDKAREKKVFLMEGYWTRFFPAWRRMQAEIDQKTIGDIRHVIADLGFVSHATNKMKRELGGGNLMATGCYLVMLAMDVFKEYKLAEIVVGNALRNKQGVDEASTVTLRFEDDRFASLTFTSNSNSACQAQICGTNGHLMLSENIWCPQRLTVTTESPKSTEKYVFPIPEVHGKQFRCPNSSGFTYECEAIRLAMCKGAIECDEMPLDESLKIAEVLQEIRMKLGVSYPQDNDQ